MAKAWQFLFVWEGNAALSDPKILGAAATFILLFALDTFDYYWDTPSDFFYSVELHSLHGVFSMSLGLSNRLELKSNRSRQNWPDLSLLTTCLGSKFYQFGQQWSRIDVRHLFPLNRFLCMLMAALVNSFGFDAPCILNPFKTTYLCGS